MYNFLGFDLARKRRLHFPVPLPDCEDRRIDDQFHQVLPRPVYQCVLVDPTHRRRIFRQFDIHTFGKARDHRVQMLKRSRARPVDVGAFIKNDVDVAVAVAKVGERTDVFSCLGTFGNLPPSSQ